MVVHVCIDGKTRLLVYCSCHDNNIAETVLTHFKEGSVKWGIPSRVRSDYGMENYQVGAFMIEKRGANRGSIITGSSVHNSRVERISQPKRARIPSSWYTETTNCKERNEAYLQVIYEFIPGL